MKTKEISFTLPFIIILYEFTFITSPKDTSASTLFYFSPFLVTLFIIPLSRIGDMKIMDALHAGLGSLSKKVYLFTQFRVIVTYIRLLLFPVNQNLDHDYPVYTSIFQTEVLISFLFLLSVFAIAIYFYISRQRSYLQKFTAFGILWFFITLSIESSFIPIIDVIYEHRLYLPGVGMIMAFSSVMYCMAWQFKKRDCYIALAVIVLSLSIAAYKRNIVWVSEQSLWEDVAAKSPNKARPYNNLGSVYDNLGNYQQAIVNFNKAIKLDPLYIDAYYNRGVVYSKLNNYKQAIADYTKTLEIEVNPHYAKAYHHRGVAYSKLSNYKQAIADYTQAININPEYAEAYYNRGIIYSNSGNYKQAIAEYTQAININPEYAEAYNNRGIIYSNSGNYKQAIADYTQAIEINPEYAEAYNNRGVAYGSLDEYQQAMADFNKTIEINPNNPNAYNNIGEVYSLLGNTEQAQKFYRKAKSLGLR